jgi:hypothetical protein
MWIAARFLAMVLLLGTATAATADDCHRALTFAEAPVTLLGIDSAAFGDFNEDGWPDVAVMTGDNRIIALNRGGVFQQMPVEVIPAPGFSIVAATLWATSTATVMRTLQSPRCRLSAMRNRSSRSAPRMVSLAQRCRLTPIDSSAPFPAPHPLPA